MFKLLLIRHADAPQMPGQIDFDRQISERGIDEAKKGKGFLQAHFSDVDLVLSSNAPRAIKTAEILFGANNFFTKETLYNANHLQIMQEIKGLSNQFKNVAIIAHNPGITDVIEAFDVKEQEPSQIVLALDHKPTCKIVALQLNVDEWGYAMFSEAEITDVFAP